METERPVQDPARPRIHRIEVVPVASIDGDVVEQVARRLGRRLGVPCRPGAPLPAAVVPGVPGRAQADADGLLRLLEARDALPGTTALGVTNLDLGHPLFTFFLGRARVGGAAVVSLARANPSYYGLPSDRETMLRRAVLECLHELGHVAGLRHCRDWRCLMRFSGDIGAVDVRGDAFCPACAARLPPTLLRG